MHLTGQNIESIKGLSYNGVKKGTARAGRRKASEESKRIVR